MEISNIKQSLTITTVLHYYNLKPDKNHRLHCPFHEDKTPSMQVYSKTNTVFCFSSNCKLHGKAIDTIDFILHKENITKSQAIKKAGELSGRVAEIIPPLTNTTENKSGNLNSLFKQLQSNLKRSQHGLLYMQQRSLNPEALGIGYNTATMSSLKHCIIFPLKDNEDNIVSLYGRNIYNNSDQKHYYQTGRKGLYPGYPRYYTKKLILTESIIDAATLLQMHEITEQYSVLACYGTNGFTDEHKEAVSQLKELTEIIFAFDNDEAGGTATAKYATELKQLLQNITISKINLPCKDVNEVAQTYDNRQLFIDLLNERTVLFSSDTEPAQAISTPLIIEPQENKNNPPQTTNNQKSSITYKNGNIYFNVESLQLQAIGGVNPRKTNQLKITIGINKSDATNNTYSVRQEVNLYNHNQMQQLIQHTCELLEVPHDLVARSLYAFRSLLEQYRDEQNSKQKTEEQDDAFYKPTYIPTLNEQSEALKRLKQNDLMQYLYDAIPQTGLIGEPDNGLLLWIAMYSCRLNKPISVICLSQSGSGKTYIIHKAAQSVPNEWQYRGTSFSEQSLFSAPQGAFKNKMMIIEDATGAQSIEYLVRELITSEDVIRFVAEAQNNGKPKTQQRKIQGPLNFFIASTKEKIYEDNANRCLIIYLDNSKEQDKRINDYYKQCKARIIDKQKEKALQHQLANMLRMLQPYEVWNIYAEYIELPEKYYVQRRGLPLFMQVIDVITNIQQYQCEQVKDHYGNILLIPHPTHIEWAFKLTRNILFRKSDELSGKVRDLIEFIKQWLHSTNKASFKASDLRKELRLEPKTCNNYLRILSSYNYLKIIGGSKGRNGLIYEVCKADTKQSLLNEVDVCIQTVMQKVWEAYQQRANSDKGTGNSEKQ